MSNRRYATIRGHEPLRTPSGWNDQDRSLVIQLESILDDIFSRFGRLKKKDLGEELRALLDSYDQAVIDVADIKAEIGDTPMGTTATTITGAIAEHEADIVSLNEIYGMTVTELKGK
jgi:hypothetical protein